MVLLSPYMFWTHQLRPSSQMAMLGMPLSLMLSNPAAHLNNCSQVQSFSQSSTTDAHNFAFVLLPIVPVPAKSLLCPEKRFHSLRHAYREAALQFLLMAVAPTGYSKAPDPPPPPGPPALLPQQLPGALHSLLTHLSQPATVPPSADSGQGHSEHASITSNLPLHQRILQQVQSQHFALQWLIKICAHLALGSSLLLPASSQAPPTSIVNNPVQAEQVGQWVLLGQVLNILDDYARMLTFSLEDVVPGHKHSRAPETVHNILLYLTAVAEAAGKTQRWVSVTSLRGCMGREQHESI